MILNLGKALGTHSLVGLAHSFWVMQGVHDASGQIGVEDWLLHGQLTL